MALSYNVDRGTINSLTYNLDTEIAAFTSALAAFSHTVNVPAPVTYPLVETIVKYYAGHYTIIENETGIPESANNSLTVKFAQLAANVANIYPIVIPPPSINAERDRRVALGITVNMNNGDIIPVQTRNEQDLINISGLSTTAIALQLAGANTTITFRDANDNNHILTLPQIVELGLKTSQGVQAIYAKSWAIKAMSPIPYDYAANNAYWA